MEASAGKNDGKFFAVFHTVSNVKRTWIVLQAFAIHVCITAAISVAPGSPNSMLVESL
jgi:hypothetical protein